MLKTLFQLSALKGIFSNTHKNACSKAALFLNRLRVFYFRFFPFSNLVLLDERLNRIFHLYKYVNPTELAMADHCTTSDLKINIRIDNARGRGRKV